MVEPSPFLPSFTLHDIDAGGIRIRAAIGGSGPPLLLLHGHPQTHVTWHKIAPSLSERFTVVAPDLRGYGDSAKPEGGDRHANYSKRVMAADQVAVMRALGFERFAVVDTTGAGASRTGWRSTARRPSRASPCSISRRPRPCTRARTRSSRRGTSGGSS